MKEYCIPIEYDILEYGIKVLFKYLLVIIVTSIFSFINHTIIETVVFLISFLFLRKYAGGFHFKSNLLCIIASIVVTTLIPYVSVLMDFNFILQFFSCVISLLIVSLLSPQDCENKRISTKDKKKYKQKSLVVLFVEMIFCLSISIINSNICSAVILSIILNAISLISAAISNNLNKKSI